MSPDEGDAALGVNESPRQVLPRGFLRSAVAENVALFLLVVLYTVAGLLVANAVAGQGKFELDLYTVSLALTVVGSIAVLVSAYLLYVVVIRRPSNPVRYVLTSFREHARWKERLLVGGPLLLTLPLFFSAFTSFKSLIPAIQPYHWDPTITHWDRFIAAGDLPWQRFAFLLHWPWVIIVLNWAYNLWFVLMYVLLLWQAFSLSNLDLRRQFLIAYFLVWMVLGTVAAIAFSSAGPCYYGELYSSVNPYAGLMASLRHIDQTAGPVWALKVQDILWAAFQSQHLALGSGISAMPSMHLANAALFALLLNRKRRIFGCVAFVYLGVLILGSVMLGWHYLSDGLVGITGAVIIWRAVGRLVHAGARRACTADRQEAAA